MCRLPLVAMLTALLAGTPALAETVRIPAGQVKLDAELMKPPGPGPFPAVVGLHGCNGLRRKDGSLDARFADWGQRLVAQGYLVIFPDSFASRGLGPQCKVKSREVRADAERPADAFATEQYLRSRRDVKADAINLIGWSNGASTVLSTLEADQKGRSRAFARAVALYPGCTKIATQGRWGTRTPLLLLIGAADDWTPAASCQQLVRAAKVRRQPAQIVTYPGAYHEFDHPGQAVHEIKGLAFTAAGGGVAHAGTNPAARADALKRVPAFLAR